MTYSLFTAEKDQIYMKIKGSKDSYLIEETRSHIQWFSITQCSTIILSGLMSTFFIKKLFATKQIYALLFFSCFFVTILILKLFAQDFTRYIEMNIYKITRAQTLKRIRMAAETYYIDDLNDFVLYLGLGQSAIIIISALVQTYFIKKLFESTGYNPMELGSIQFISPPDKSYY